LHLPGAAVLVHPRSRTHDLVRGQTEGRRDECGGHRAVADTHVAGDEHLRPGVDLLGGHATAEVERAFDLVRCQRVLDVDGAGTVAHLERPDLLGDVVEVDVHRDVEHPYPCADLAGQYGDPALPGHERPQHGRGDLPWIRRPVRPRTGDAVIACEHGITRTRPDRKSTRLNSSHVKISYAVFCLKKKRYTEVIRQMLTKQSV